MPIFQDPERVISSFGNSSSKSPTSENESVQNPSWLQQHWRRDVETPDVEMSGTSPTHYQSDNYTSAHLHARERDELIQSIKREQNSGWISQLSSEEHAYQQHRPSHTQAFELHNDTAHSPQQALEQDMSITHGKRSLAPSPEIERPRSALHSGDFREGSQDRSSEYPSRQRLNSLSYEHASSQRFGSSPTTPWYLPSFSSHSHTRDPETSPLAGRVNLPGRSRAPSLGSFSSSYILKAPTSPLVYQANNADLDFSPKSESADSSAILEKSSRRRTLPPETFKQLRGSPPVQSRGFNFSKSYASVQREESLPFQAHQPRRSSTYSLQLASSPQTHFRPRRPSLASDLSPRIHASMVGSYEESILRGRMSTTPSKPLDFTAQIGVMGKGKCKASLKCPPHITVPFPAVFYSYPTSGNGRSISDDSPSPYVGLIDLESSLPQDKSREERRNRRHKTPSTENKDSDTRSHSPKSNSGSSSRKTENREKRSSRSDALKTPLGGFYRIPQRGQLQIVIKNPNKTAVKLFLVPYDLDDMEPGSKTFIRQRSYSAGPIIDMPLTARKNFGTDRPEASLNSTDDPKDKPMLRYLIHLNICCTAKGRFYLYSTIRVVFANRVPDGKEKLRNEIQYPEPRYSPYRPVKELSNTNYRSAIDKQYKRRSAGVGFTASHFHEDDNTHTPSPFPHHSPSASSASATASAKISALPFKLSTPKPRRSPVQDAGPSVMFGSNAWHPVSPDPFQKMVESPPFSTNSSIFGTSSTSQSPKDVQHDNDNDDDNNNNKNELYNKLKRGDAGYGGGYPFGSLTTESSEMGGSLLAKKLKDWTCNSNETSPGR